MHSAEEVQVHQPDDTRHTSSCLVAPEGQATLTGGDTPRVQFTDRVRTPTTEPDEHWAAPTCRARPGVPTHPPQGPTSTRTTDWAHGKRLQGRGSCHSARGSTPASTHALALSTSSSSSTPATPADRMHLAGTPGVDTPSTGAGEEVLVQGVVHAAHWVGADQYSVGQSTTLQAWCTAGVSSVHSDAGLMTPRVDTQDTGRDCRPAEPQDWEQGDQGPARQE